MNVWNISPLLLLVLNVFCADPPITGPHYVKIHANIEECVKQEGADMKTFTTGGPFTVPSDPKSKCVFKCLMQKLNHMDDKGNIIKSALEKGGPMHGPPEEVKQAVLKCADIKESDMCETAYKFTVCFMDTIKSMKKN